MKPNVNIPMTVIAHFDLIDEWVKTVDLYTSPNIDEEKLRDFLITDARFRYTIGEFMPINQDRLEQVRSLTHLLDVVRIRKALFKSLNEPLKIQFIGYSDEWVEDLKAQLWERTGNDDLLDLTYWEFHLCGCDGLVELVPENKSTTL